ncbi:hypothetical protein GMMP1_1230009 [Candidatus Magnetomoraceae bacterium gMMP-1]
MLIKKANKIYSKFRQTVKRTFSAKEIARLTGFAGEEAKKILTYLSSMQAETDGSSNTGIIEIKPGEYEYNPERKLDYRYAVGIHGISTKMDQEVLVANYKKYKNLTVEAEELIKKSIVKWKIPENQRNIYILDASEKKQQDCFFGDNGIAPGFVLRNVGYKFEIVIVDQIFNRLTSEHQIAFLSYLIELSNQLYNQQNEINRRGGFISIKQAEIIVKNSLSEHGINIKELERKLEQEHHNEYMIGELDWRNAATTSIGDHGLTSLEVHEMEDDIKKEYERSSVQSKRKELSEDITKSLNLLKNNKALIPNDLKSQIQKAGHLAIYGNVETGGQIAERFIDTGGKKVVWKDKCMVVKDKQDPINKECLIVELPDDVKSFFSVMNIGVLEALGNNRGSLITLLQEAYQTLCDMEVTKGSNYIGAMAGMIASLFKKPGDLQKRIINISPYIRFLAGYAEWTKAVLIRRVNARLSMLPDNPYGTITFDNNTGSNCEHHTLQFLAKGNNCTFSIISTTSKLPEALEKYSTDDDINRVFKNTRIHDLHNDHVIGTYKALSDLGRPSITVTHDSVVDSGLLGRKIIETEFLSVLIPGLIDERLADINPDETYADFMAGMQKASGRMPKVNRDANKAFNDYVRTHLKAHEGKVDWKQFYENILDHQIPTVFGSPDSPVYLDITNAGLSREFKLYILHRSIRSMVQTFMGRLSGSYEFLEAAECLLADEGEFSISTPIFINTINKLRQKKTIVVYHIGGSAEGIKLINNVFGKAENDPKILYIEDNDVYDMHRKIGWMNEEDWREAAVINISKSGDTAEVRINFNYGIQQMKKAYGNSWPEEIIAITGTTGELKEESDRRGYVVFRHPDKTDGRFTLFWLVHILIARVFMSEKDIKTMLRAVVAEQKRTQIPFEEFKQRHDSDILPQQLKNNMRIYALQNVTNASGPVLGAVLSSLNLEQNLPPNVIKDMQEIGIPVPGIKGDNRGIIQTVNFIEDLKNISKWLKQLIDETAAKAGNETKSISTQAAYLPLVMPGLFYDPNRIILLIKGKKAPVYNTKMYNAARDTCTANHIPNISVVVDDIKDPAGFGTLFIAFMQSLVSFMNTYGVDSKEMKFEGQPGVKAAKLTTRQIALARQTSKNRKQASETGSVELVKQDLKNFARMADRVIVDLQEYAFETGPVFDPANPQDLEDRIFDFARNKITSKVQDYNKKLKNKVKISTLWFRGDENIRVLDNNKKDGYLLIIDPIDNADTLTVNNQTAGGSIVLASIKKEIIPFEGLKSIKIDNILKNKNIELAYHFFYGPYHSMLVTFENKNGNKETFNFTYQTLTKAFIQHPRGSREDGKVQFSHEGKQKGINGKSKDMPPVIKKFINMVIREKKDRNIGTSADFIEHLIKKGAFFKPLSLIEIKLYAPLINGTGGRFAILTPQGIFNEKNIDELHVKKSHFGNLQYWGIFGVSQDVDDFELAVSADMKSQGFEKDWDKYFKIFGRTAEYNKTSQRKFRSRIDESTVTDQPIIEWIKTDNTQAAVNDIAVVLDQINRIGVSKILPALENIKASDTQSVMNEEAEAAKSKYDFSRIPKMSEHC